MTPEQLVDDWANTELTERKASQKNFANVGRVLDIHNHFLQNHLHLSYERAGPWSQSTRAWRAE